MGTRREGGRLQVTKPARTSISTFTSLQDRGKYISVVQTTQSVVVCYGSPSKLIQCLKTNEILFLHRVVGECLQKLYS